jgi:ankyrin repeat protein
MKIAARKGNLDIVKLLVENGADIDATDNDKNKPLSIGNNVELINKIYNFNLYIFIKLHFLTNQKWLNF